VVLGWASLLWHWINLFSAPGTCIEAPPDLDAELAQLEAAEGERQEAAKN
jgi:hypothetical protein